MIKYVCMWCWPIVSSIEHFYSVPWGWNSWGGDLWQLSSFRKLCFQADKKNSEKISFCICCFSSATSQNSQYTEVAYFGVLYSECLFEVVYSAAFQLPNTLMFFLLVISHRDAVELNYCYLIRNIYWTRIRARLSWIHFESLVSDLPSTMQALIPDFPPLP